jgi:sporulation protein YlmC with PRC-barrel domain
MTLRKPLLVSFSLAAFASASVLAQQAQPQAPQPQAQQSQQQPEQQQSSPSAQQQQDELRVSELQGMKVNDAQGQEIGDIEDVVIDLQSGKVHAAVVEFGGVMGVGGKSYAFPMSEFQPGKNKNQLVLNVDKQKLENTEGFAKGQWPEMGDDYWGRVGGQQQAASGQSSGGQASAGAGAPQSPSQGASPKLIRASDVIGKEVQDKSGQEVGEVNDMTVSLQDGSLKEVTLKLKGGGEAKAQAKDLTAGLDDKLVIGTSADQLKSQAQPSRSQPPQQQEQPKQQ